MNWLWVIPVVNPLLADRALRSIRVPPEDVLVIDNTPQDPGFRLSTQPYPTLDGQGLNHGCARSWNIGVQRAMREGRPGVVLASPSVEWGRAGGLDVHEAVEATADAWGAFGAGLGWHLHCWRLGAFQRIGMFDERIYPVYFEDDDWLRRVKLAGGGDRRAAAADPGEAPTIPVDAEKGAPNQSTPYVRSYLDLGHLGAYYLAKWGGLPPDEKYVTPFGLDVGLAWWPGHAYAGTVGAPAS